MLTISFQWYSFQFDSKVFPNLANSIFTQCLRTSDGEELESKIVEIQKAEEQYDDAIASGHSAIMMKPIENKKDEFKWFEVSFDFLIKRFLIKF